MQTVAKKGSKIRRQCPGSGQKNFFSVIEDEQLLQSGSYPKATGVQELMGVSSKSVSTEVELILCSRTGKKTYKCNGEPRLPLKAEKMATLERLEVRKENTDFKKKFYGQT